MASVHWQAAQQTQKESLPRIFWFEGISNLIASLKLEYLQTNLMPRIQGSFVTHLLQNAQDLE